MLTCIEVQIPGSWKNSGWRENCKMKETLVDLHISTLQDGGGPCLNSEGSSQTATSFHTAPVVETRAKDEELQFPILAFKNSFYEKFDPTQEQDDVDGYSIIYTPSSSTLSLNSSLDDYFRDQNLPLEVRELQTPSSSRASIAELSSNVDSDEERDTQDCFTARWSLFLPKLSGSQSLNDLHGIADNDITLEQERISRPLTSADNENISQGTLCSSPSVSIAQNLTTSPAPSPHLRRPTSLSCSSAPRASSSTQVESSNVTNFSRSHNLQATNPNLDLQLLHSAPPSPYPLQGFRDPRTAKRRGPLNVKNIFNTLSAWLVGVASAAVNSSGKGRWQRGNRVKNIGIRIGKIMIMSKGNIEDGLEGGGGNWMWEEETIMSGREIARRVDSVVTRGLGR